MAERHGLEGRGDHARRAAAGRGPRPGGRRRAVPLRGAPRHRRRAVRRADDRRSRGGRLRRGGRARRHAHQAGRLRRLLVDPELRPLPVLRAGRQNLCDLAATIGDGLQISDHTSRHHVGGHRPHHHLHGRLLRAAHRGERGVRDPGGPGGAAGGRLPHRLRGGDRLGQRGVRRRRPGRQRRRGDRRRRPRLGGGPGRPAGRRAARLRRSTRCRSSGRWRASSARRTRRGTRPRRST